MVDDVELSNVPAVLQLSRVSKHFIVRKDNSLKERLLTGGRRGRRHREDFTALSAIDLEVFAGTTVGLIGHNGSGKSTLLSVIGGIIEPTEGTVRRRGRLAALLELGAGFHPDLTGRENVYLNGSILGLDSNEIDARFAEIVEFSGIGDFIDTQVKFYSSGMYVRLAFAVAVNTDPDILLVDEVLAVGDEAFQRRCLEKIRQFQAEGRTIILVTHDLATVIKFCDRAVLLDHGRLVYDGLPRAAVSLFRDLLEGRRIDVEESGRHVALGSIPEVSAVFDRDGDGPDLTVDVEVVYRGRLEFWDLVVQIDDLSGRAVFVTRCGGGAFPDLSGSRRIRATVDDVPLSPGRYLVSAYLLDSKARHVVDAVQAGDFEVPGEDLGGGILRGRSEFRALD